MRLLSATEASRQIQRKGTESDRKWDRAGGDRGPSVGSSQKSSRGGHLIRGTNEPQVRKDKGASVSEKRQ